MALGKPVHRPVRVLHIITRLIVGGAQENTLHTVMAQQRNPTFHVTLLCGIDHGPEGNLEEGARAAGVDLVVMPSLINPIRPFTDLRALIHLYRFIRGGRYDIVHTHSSKAGILGRVAARMAGVPFVVHTLHSLVFHDHQAPWKNWCYIRMKRLCSPLADVLISVNTRTAQGALAAGIGRPEQHVTIYSGMELDPFLTIGDRLPVAEAKHRLGIPPDAPVVGKVARLSPLKGHQHFLAAAAEIARQEPRAWFLLVGDGVLRRKLEAQTRRVGTADRTVFAGLVAPDEVPACIQAMDVVVHTSVREGIARVLPQAGAAGKPIVTFDLDGASEGVRDGISGYLVPPLDTATLAARVLELLRDPERRRAFGEAGRAVATANFRAEQMVERINEVYYRLLASR